MTKIEDKTVCVTGAAGFIGSSLCRGLLKKGANIIALDKFSGWQRDNLKEIEKDIEIVRADITDINSLRDPISRSQIVFHLAAIDNRVTCRENFPLVFDVNIKGTFNVASLCSNLDRMVYMSSNMVYGEQRYLPIDENHPLDGRDPYAVSKITSEYLFKAFDFIQDLPYTIVRNFNTFGPRQNIESLIPSIIMEGLTKDQIDVWTPSVLRDFQYVEDCTDALIEIVESDSTLHEIVNLGSGRGTTTGELANIVCEYLNTSWVDLKKPAPESSKFVSDITKIQALTKWKPRMTLEEGLRRTIDYYRETV